MHRLRSLAVSLVAALSALTFAVAPAAAQQHVLIDFAEFRSDTAAEYQATPGGEVTSKGFEFYDAYGTYSRNALGTWGQDPTQDFTAANQPTNLTPGTAALFGTAFNSRMDMLAANGGLFQLYSMQVAHMYARESLLSGDLQPITLYVYGFNAAGSNSVTTAFTIPVPPLVGNTRPPLLYTLNFGSAWTGLSDVAWFQGSGPYSSTAGGATTTGSAYSHQFTAIDVALLPEPGTWAMVTVGLTGVLVATRRRRVQG